MNLSTNIDIVKLIECSPHVASFLEVNPFQVKEISQNKLHKCNKYHI